MDFTVRICETVNDTIEKFQKVYGKVVRVLDMFFEWFKRLKDGCKLFQIAW